MSGVPEALHFGPDGLLPAIVQDASDGTVLMLAYMNRDALDMTMRTGYAHFWSRSRQALWKKGETSGNVQRVVAISYDCDGDAILLKVTQHNVACHTGQRSCFYRHLELTPLSTATPPAAVDTPAHLAEVLDAVYRLILLRRDSGERASSYVKRLFEGGHDGMAKKVVEEAAEVLLASKNVVPAEIVYEMADLWFHALVLLGYHTIHPHEILRELQRRLGQPGGGKPAPSAAV
jgi:phosphoribosyl-ATP pyrophosphohydrolase/phosphoribosyl-AMP cyclohydrolase